MKWGGRRAQQWSRSVLERYGRVCLLQLEGCTRVATTGDHIIPKVERPDLAYVVTNGRPACRRCNSKRNADFLAAAPVVDNRADFFESGRPAGSHTHQSPPRPSRNSAGPDRTEPEEARS